MRYRKSFNRSRRRGYSSRARRSRRQRGGYLVARGGIRL